MFIITSFVDIAQEFTDVHPTDYYVLEIILTFTGLIFYCLCGYCNLFQIINDLNSDRSQNRYLPFFRGPKSIAYWAVLFALIGTIVSTIRCILPIFYYLPSQDKYPWLVPFNGITGTLSGLSFMAAGFAFMFINEVWIYKPQKLAFWVAWFGGIGGINFFILGIGKFFAFNSNLTFWLVIVPNLVGTIFYLFTHILTLFMWKKEQFGSSYLPHLNYTKLETETKKNVLYRDLFFLCLYIAVGILQIIGISYASLCDEFQDWTKGYVKGLSAAFFILLMGSFLHKEPERVPFSYLLWYLRVWFIWTFFDGIIDNFHISGNQCETYGNQ